MQKFLDDLIETLTFVAKKLDLIVGDILEGLLVFIEKLTKWFVRQTKKIYEYLARFFIAIGRLISASFKLILFYSPTLLFFIVAYYRGGIIWWLVGIIWFAFITGIGLTYGKNRREDSNKTSEIKNHTDYGK